MGCGIGESAEALANVVDRQPAQGARPTESVKRGPLELRPRRRAAGIASSAHASVSRTAMTYEASWCAFLASTRARSSGSSSQSERARSRYASVSKTLLMPPPSDRRSQARTRSGREKESSSGSSRSVTRWRSPAPRGIPRGRARGGCGPESRRESGAAHARRGRRSAAPSLGPRRRPLLPPPCPRGPPRAAARPSPDGAPAARRLRRRRRASGGERGGRVPATRTSPQRPARMRGAEAIAVKCDHTRVQRVLEHALVGDRGQPRHSQVGIERECEH